MITFDRTAYKERLFQEGYTNHQINEMVKNIDRINERLNDALNAWISDGTIVNFEVEGVTLKKIMEKTGANFYSALFMMSVFIEKPEEARIFQKLPFFIRDRRE